MRLKFTLINNYGREYSLNNVTGGFLAEVGGLGYSIDAKYTRLGGRFVRDYWRDNQPEIKGKIYFYGVDAFTVNREFTAFIRGSATLRIKCDTPNGTRYRDCDLTNYDILSAGTNMLECPVTLKCTSLWYEDVETKHVLTFDGDANEARYSYRFSARFNDASSGKVTFINDGSVPATLKVTFMGAVTNPSLSLRVDGVEVSRVDIIGEASAGETINYSSQDDDLYCYIDKGTEKINLVGAFNITNANFFKIPVGTSEIVVSASSALVNPVVFTMRKGYRAL